MTSTHPARPRNRLLRVLEPDDFGRLRPHLTSRDLPLKQVLIAAGAPVETIVFPETGLVSITTDDVEIGMIGREGVVGAAPVLLGAGMSPHIHLVQVAGTGQAIGVREFEAALAGSPRMRQAFLRFVHVQMVQMGETGAANARHSTVVRLARWLLMCDDRIQAGEVPITHEFLAVMLGVHRPGVTLALQTLEERRMIRGRRALVQLLDRSGLERLVASGYGMAEAEYDRLFGPARHGAGGSPAAAGRKSVEPGSDFDAAEQDVRPGGAGPLASVRTPAN